MPSNYNEDTGMIETLRERYQREVREMLELGIIESPLYSPEDNLNITLIKDKQGDTNAIN